MKHELEQAVAAAVQECFGAVVSIDLTRPEAQFGDFATNVALQLAGKLGKNPREIGEALAEHLRSDDRLSEVTVAGPGFLNLRMSDAAVLAGIGAEAGRSLAGQKVLVEYSDPNPFKPLHAGHLYTTLVGDTIARLVENAGAETVRLNFGGDVGLHVAKSMWSIIKWLNGTDSSKLSEIPVGERPSWLGARYVEGNNAYEDSVGEPEVVGQFVRLKKGSIDVRLDILKLNRLIYRIAEDQTRDGINEGVCLKSISDREIMVFESDLRVIYFETRSWSYDYFATLYEQLQVVPFDRFIPESEVTPLGLSTVREQLERGVFSQSDGAVVFRGDDHGLHTRVFINSEGLPTYETKDVGLSLTKWRDYQFDESIIITANEQMQYMQVVIKAIEQFAPEPAQRTRHLTHGVVKLQGGVKMSSRKGNVVTALEILEAARAAGQASGTNPSEETILAAVKYAFAKNRIGGDIIYDPQESIALEGNSGPYIQYAHARAESILSRHSELDSESRGSTKETLNRVQGDIMLQQDERRLVRKLGEYSEVIDKATAELMPHHICTYLYELAQEFNRFYEKNRVIGDEREAIRLGLVGAYADTLKRGLGLLGIHAPERM